MGLYSFIIGAVIGSFLNVLIVRLPEKKSIIYPRSSCPKCGHKIAWYYNIPIFSYLFLKGRCAYCKEAISKNYFIVELLSAFITLSLFLKFGLGFELFVTLAFFYTLIVLTFIDFKYKAVPDYLLLVLFIISFFVTKFDLLESLKSAATLLGAFVILNFLLTFYIQNIKAKILKDDSLKSQQALGEGDFPVLGAIAVILGLKGAFIAIFLSSIFAIIPSIYYSIKKKDIQTPYIPYLALGFAFEYFFNISKVFN